MSRSEETPIISDAELDVIEARCGATSPPPWKAYFEGRDHTSGSNVVTTGLPGNRGPDLDIAGATPVDLDFIASARQDVPRLVAEIRRLRRIATKRR
jgi:hypothetical protein